MEKANQETKRLSGAQKRKKNRNKGAGKAATNSLGQNTNDAKLPPKVTGGGRQPKTAYNGKPKDQRVAAPAGVSKNNKKSANQAAIQSQAFDLVRQKLVSSLLQVLPQSDNWNNGGSGGLAGWGNNMNQVPSNGQRGWNGNNNNNNNMNGNINNNNNNMNRGVSNAQGGWNNNNANNNMNRSAANSQGYWSNTSINNRNRLASNSQGAYGISSNNNMNRGSGLSASFGLWNNNNLNQGASSSLGGWNNSNGSNMNQSASSFQGGWNNNNGNNMNQSTSSMAANWGSNNSSMNQGAPNAWNINNNQQSNNNNSYSSAWNDSTEAPAPPPWSNGNSSGSQNGAQQSMWDNNYSDDPRNAGGREFFSQFDGGDINDFDDVGSVDLKFSIVDMNNPGGRILGRHQNLLKSAFNQALADVVLKADSRVPPIQIKYARFIQNSYKICVASPKCVPVLRNIVDRLPSPWYGSMLRLVPHQPAIKLTKASLYINSGALKRNDQEILMILERQNAGLKTDKWRLITRKEKDDGVLLIVRIDDHSIDYLNKSKGKLFFLTHYASVKLGKKPDGPVGETLAIMPKKAKSKNKTNKAN